MFVCHIVRKLSVLPPLRTTTAAYPMTAKETKKVEEDPKSAPKEEHDAPEDLLADVVGDIIQNEENKEEKPNEPFDNSNKESLNIKADEKKEIGKPSIPAIELSEKHEEKNCLEKEMKKETKKEEVKKEEVKK